MAVLLVALGGGLGSVTRYLVGGWVANRFGDAFPYGTLLINITASFIVAFFLAFAQERAALNPDEWHQFGTENGTSLAPPSDLPRGSRFRPGA